jgi:hypothetical protein
MPMMTREAARQRSSKASRQQGIKSAKQQGSQAARQQGSRAARQPGSKAARQQGSKAARQQGSEAGRQQGSKAARQQGSKAARKQSSKEAKQPGPHTPKGPELCKRAWSARLRRGEEKGETHESWPEGSSLHRPKMRDVPVLLRSSCHASIPFPDRRVHYAARQLCNRVGVAPPGRRGRPCRGGAE